MFWILFYCILIVSGIQILNVIVQTCREVHRSSIKINTENDNTIFKNNIYEVNEHHKCQGNETREAQYQKKTDSSI